MRVPLSKQSKALAQKQFVSPYGIASYYAVIGDNERALDWLEKAYSERDGTLVWLKVHPRLDGLRGRRGRYFGVTDAPRPVYERVRRNSKVEEN